jgi:hypothetical protein
MFCTVICKVFLIFVGTPFSSATLLLQDTTQKFILTRKSSLIAFFLPARKNKDPWGHAAVLCPLLHTEKETRPEPEMPCHESGVEEVNLHMNFIVDPLETCISNLSGGRTHYEN